MGGDGLSGFQYVGNIRLTILVQRRRHADNDGFDFFNACKIAGREQPAFGNFFLNRFAGDVLDIGLPTVDPFDLEWVNVQAKDMRSRLRKLKTEWKPDITQTDNRNFHR